MNTPKPLPPPTAASVGPWDRGAAEKAAIKMFGNQALHRVAAALGGSHPRALDYIRQAPVIVLAANAGFVGRSNGMRAQSYAGPPMRMMAERGEKLREVMSFYGCAFHLRKLQPSVLHPTRWPVVYHLGRLPPSTLSQIIPAIRKDQDVWLRALVAWSEHVRRRCGNPWFLFEWAASALRAIDRGHERTVDIVADLAIAAHQASSPLDGATFDLRWTFDQAQAAASRWHARLARLSAEKRAAKDLGVEFTLAVPYAPFPDARRALGGFEFVPLRSCEDLYVEGAAMRHCVASYSRAVMAGSARIFSVQHDGRRVATAEYGRDVPNGPFRLVQIKGPCNTAPLKAVQTCATSFAKVAVEARQQHE